MIRWMTPLLIAFAAHVFAQPFPGLSEAIEQGEAGSIKALLISRSGELVYEDYFRGASADELQVMNSVTKSIGSALIGIAHRQGKIRLDDTLDLFFDELYPLSTPGYANKRAITVEQVLQQRHGLAWDELSVDYTSVLNPTASMIQSDDWYRFVLTRPMDAEPGQTFTYSTGASTLMSRMIRKASGIGPEQFAMQELFLPLGIERVRWEGSDGTGGPNGFTNWPNPDHDPSLGYSLWLRPRDMVTIGELYLDGGVHEGKRILDTAWIEATRVLHSNASNADFFAATPDSGYGYQWWIAKLNDDRDRAWSMFYASGWGRQYILVLPELGLVVASVADDYGYSGPGIGSLLNRLVLPDLAPLLDERFNGAWYDPGTAGQGLTLEVLDDGGRLLGFWYTYDEVGNQRWFVLDGTITGSEADVSVVETQGGIFLQNNPVSTEEWGRGRLVVFDCDHVNLHVESDEVTATIPLTRLTGRCKGEL